MIISKCVPMEISRERFSDFLECEMLSNTESLYLVGYDEIEGIKKNKRLKFSNVKEYIDSLEDKCNTNSSNLKAEFELQIKNLQNQILELKGEEVLPDEPQMNEVVFFKAEYDENLKTSRVNLKNTLGCVEINGGGYYEKEFVIFDNPIIGVVTRIIVDNSGKLDENGNLMRPEGDFILNYGINDYDENDGTPLWYEIACVPMYNTCIVEILHTSKTDVIINTTYTPSRFVEDAPAAYEYVDDQNKLNVIQISDNTSNSYDIDLEDERTYLEFECAEGHDDYTFWFNNPELGSMTYLFITNPTSQEIIIKYSKRGVDETGIPIIELQPNERTVIEIFHSLSADIIAKVTIV